MTANTTPSTTQLPADAMRLLALCPLLAVSDTVAKAIATGLLLLVLAPVSLLIHGSLRRVLPQQVRLPAMLVMLAALLGCTELLLRAFYPELHDALGVYLPLIGVNSALLALSLDADLTIVQTLRRGLRLGASIAVALLLLGAARELVGHGSLLHDGGRLLGDWASGLHVYAFRVEMGFLLAMLPPGAFISLGLLIAGRNWWRLRGS